jgi:starch synthase
VDALSVYQNKERWKQLMLHGMTADFSWERSAREYGRLYKRALAKARKENEKNRVVRAHI